MEDSLVDGSKLRVFTAIDLYSRECVALLPAKHFTGGNVANILDAARASRRAFPKSIRVDNGTEFTSKALDQWAYLRGVRLDFSRPGKPVDNTFIEAFNGSVRRECLSQHWFFDIEDAQQTLDAWKEDYNKHRPHSSLGNLPPAEFEVSGGAFLDRVEPEK